MAVTDSIVSARSCEYICVHVHTCVHVYVCVDCAIQRKTSRPQVETVLSWQDSGLAWSTQKSGLNTPDWACPSPIVVVQLLMCPALCDPMNCGTPGSSVLHCVPELDRKSVV